MGDLKNLRLHPKDRMKIFTVVNVTHSLHSCSLCDLLVETNTLRPLSL